MIRYLLPILLAFSSTASAVVVRGDVDDARYHAPESVFPPLVDLPGQGHGVLIAPQWVVTAAHLIGRLPLEEVTINGKPRRIERVIVHPGYMRLPEWMISQALISRDMSKPMAQLASRDDLALLKLASPVMDVAPAPLYRGADEVGKTAELFGKGATGNGDDGEVLKGPNRTRLRQAANLVTGSDERWLSYTFDPPPAALPLEGAPGSGDTGGPLVIERDGQRQLAGVASWNTYVPSDERSLHGGLYGQVVHAARISRYTGWIESVMSAETSGAAVPAETPPGE